MLLIGTNMNAKTRNIGIGIALVLVVLLGSKAGILSGGYNCPIGNGNITYSSLCKALQVGSSGVVTGASIIPSFINNGQGGNPFSGSAWLINLAVTGQLGGQSITGTMGSIAQVAGTTSSSPNTQVGITYNLQNENITVPYQNSFINIQQWSFASEPLSIQIPPIGAFGQPTCTDTAIGNNTYTLSCSGGLSSSYAFFNNLTIQRNFCQNQFGNGAVIALSGSGASFSWFQPSSTNYQCIVATGKPYYTNTYTATGTWNANVNVSVTFTNTTTQGQIYLTNTAPSGYLDNGNAYADIYNYNVGSGGITFSNLPCYSQIGTTFAPVYLLAQNCASLYAAKSKGFVNAGFDPAVLGTQYGFTLSNGGSAQYITGVYLLQGVQVAESSRNNQITPLLSTIPSSSFYGAQSGINYSIGQFQLSIPVIKNGVLNGNLGGVPIQPNIQLIAKLATLSIYVPTISQPLTLTESPNPATYVSGNSTTVTLTVSNPNPVSVQFTASGTCSAAGSTTQFSFSNGVGPQTASGPGILNQPLATSSPYYNGTGTYPVSCSGSIIPTLNPSLASTFGWQGTVKACNNLNGCGTTPPPICNTNQTIIYNVTQHKYVCQNNPGGGGPGGGGCTLGAFFCSPNVGLYILAALAIIGIIVFLGRSRSGGSGRAYRHPPSGSGFKFDNNTLIIIAGLVVLGYLIYTNNLGYALIAAVILGALYFVSKALTGFRPLGR